MNPLHAFAAQRVTMTWLAIGALGCATAVSVPASGENLSRGKPYSLAPLPSYRHCTDEGDAVQLTDGKVFRQGDAGSMWTWQGTVGWHISQYVMIVIDLEKRCRIDRISYHSVGGGHADVYYPKKSEFFISENGIDYTLVRTLTPADDGIHEPPRHGPRRGSEIHTFAADGIKRTGRYVMLGLSINEWAGYQFTDEVTVHGKVLPNQAEGNVPADATVEVANHYLTHVHGSTDGGGPLMPLIVDRPTHMRCNLRRVQRVLDQAGGSGAKMTPAQETAYQAMEAHIAVLAKGIGADPTEDQWRAFVTTTLAMYARARALPLTGRGYVVWDKPMWQSLAPADMPEATTPTLQQIRIRAVGNEYESACITVSNVSPIPLVLRIAPPMLFTAKSGLTGPPVSPYTDRVVGPAVPEVAGGAGGWVRLRQVAFAETGTGMIGDALPELGEAGLFVVPPASTSQLWLTISTKDVPAGEYTALLKMIPLRTAAFKPSQVKIDLTVLKTRLEGIAPIRAIGWSYPRFTEIVGHDRSAARDQVDHYMDAFVIEVGRCRPWGVYAPDGSVIEPMDYTHLDRYLDLYKDGQMVLLWRVPSMIVKGPDGTKTYSVGDPGWNAPFKTWLTALVAHMNARGLTYENFAFYPYDEPHTAERGKAYLLAANAFKKADPKVKTFVTAPGIPLDRLQTWLPSTDIFCLGGPEEDPKAQALVKAGAEVWYYGGGAGKAAHPIGVARRNFWRAFHLGLKGQGVWAYACSGWQTTGAETAWTEMDNSGGRGDNSMIYRGKYGPVTSKRWEAWRDGVEDHWLLTILEKAHQGGRTGVDPHSLVAQAVTRPPKKIKGDMDPLEMALYADAVPEDTKRILTAREKLMDAVAGLE